jgi:hypothetical protein
MNHVTSIDVHKYVLAMSVSESMQTCHTYNVASRKIETYPRMKPTMHMTAIDRPYVNRLVSQAVGSGKVSINHSWKTGLNLIESEVIST